MVPSNTINFLELIKIFKFHFLVYLRNKSKSILMSFSIDFEELPYDLYKILNLEKDCTMKEIKKNYKKAVLQYHPDKNNNVDEEFFSYISVAYKILSNPQNRQAYDEWMNWKNDHEDLKVNFRKQEPVSFKKNFNQVEAELNKKHGFNPNQINPLSKDETSHKLKQLQNARNNISVPTYNIKNVNDAFDKVKTNSTEFKQEVIPYSGDIMEYTPNSNNFASLDDIGTLYKEGEDLKEKNLSSMNNAFRVQHKINYVEDNRSFEDRMKDYNNQTKSLNEILPKPKKKTLFER